MKFTTETLLGVIFAGVAIHVLSRIADGIIDWIFLWTQN